LDAKKVLVVGDQAARIQLLSMVLTNCQPEVGVFAANIRSGRGDWMVVERPDLVVVTLEGFSEIVVDVLERMRRQPGAPTVVVNVGNDWATVVWTLGLTPDGNLLAAYSHLKALLAAERPREGDESRQHLQEPHPGLVQLVQEVSALGFLLQRHLKDDAEEEARWHLLQRLERAYAEAVGRGSSRGPRASGVGGRAWRNEGAG